MSKAWMSEEAARQIKLRIAHIARRFLLKPDCACGHTLHREPCPDCDCEVKPDSPLALMCGIASLVGQLASIAIQSTLVKSETRWKLIKIRNDVQKRSETLRERNLEVSPDGAKILTGALNEIVDVLHGEIGEKNLRAECILIALDGMAEHGMEAAMPEWFPVPCPECEHTMHEGPCTEFCRCNMSAHQFQMGFSAFVLGSTLGAMSETGRLTEEEVQLVLRQRDEGSMMPLIELLDGAIHRQQEQEDRVNEEIEEMMRAVAGGRDDWRSA